MNKVRPLSIDDPALDCPVPPETVGRLIKADPESTAFLLDGIPEATRARLAVWLYGRSHTHEAGVRVAATCDGPTLRRAAGSYSAEPTTPAARRPYAPPSHGTRAGASRISLGGSQRRA
jgi:hypothetical protein